MADSNDTAIEETLLRLLDGPLGERLCNRVASQVEATLGAKSVSKTELVGYLTTIREALETSIKHTLTALEPLLADSVNLPIRLHNLELSHVLHHGVSGIDGQEHARLKAVLLTRIHDRLLNDLMEWSTREDFPKEAKEAMQRYLNVLHPSDKTSN